MKKRSSIVALFACVLGVVALVLAGCGGGGSTESSSTSSTNESAATSTKGSYTLVKDGTLTCVSELGFAPFEYLEAGSTEPIGYDIDVANEIAKRLGLSCSFLPSQDFDSLVPTIKEGGKADIAIAGITISDDRAKEIDFSDPYFESNLALIVKSDSKETAETLNAKDKKVACQTGTTGDAWIEENLPDAEKVPLTDISAGLAGVSTGSYDAYVVDLPVAKKNLSDSFTDLTILEEIATGEQYGIAVSKNNPELTKAINGALAEMQSDGTLQKIWDKWMVEADVPEE
ncbi:MAG: amino acid ABC transporter substrate-binding protein [Atopobiaceae bacterium]|nr:amino acid ABC transporter substrate-binding protein [Atopobiaceae bacterium]